MCSIISAWFFAFVSSWYYLIITLFMLHHNYWFIDCLIYWSQRELHSVQNIDLFRWDTHLYMPLFPFVRSSVRPSVCRTPYLRNHTSSNHQFWYTCVKWWHLQEFFSFFLTFWWKSYLRNSIAYDHEFWYNCIKLWYLQMFFSLFWNFHFRAVRG